MKASLLRKLSSMAGVDTDSLCSGTEQSSAGSLKSWKERMCAHEETYRHMLSEDVFMFLLYNDGNVQILQHPRFLFQFMMLYDYDFNLYITFTHI